ncbi:MAG: DNA primase catalytic subunit PriS [Candidatus Hadarchaeales archaeon]
MKLFSPSAEIDKSTMLMREATREERQLFYREEWTRRELPDFIRQTLSLREFGFDLDGSGPSHRYNQFMTVDQLEEFLKNMAPYSAYASVALYERPTKREGWLKAELALDIDAKDLPLKSCSCTEGKVCESCIYQARDVALEFIDTLRGDLGFRNIITSYSGRGFHIRILDEAAMQLESAERNQFVTYVAGGAVPSNLSLLLGYSKVFRERAARTLERLDEERLAAEVGVRRTLTKLLQEKPNIVNSLRSGRADEIFSLEGLGAETITKLLSALAKLNSEFTDGKVTVDTKRILRLPSSLHSGVSMKCMVVKNLESFNIDDAIPKFVRERGE